MVVGQTSGQWVKPKKTSEGCPLRLASVKGWPSVVTNRYRIGSRPRGRYGKVRARWRDRKADVTRNVDVETGLEGPRKTLREAYQDEAEARRAADAAAREVKGGEVEVTLQLVGNTLARAETPIVVQGVSLDLDGRWIASSVTHHWNFEAGGATTEIGAGTGLNEDG